MNDVNDHDAPDHDPVDHDAVDHDPTMAATGPARASADPDAAMGDGDAGATDPIDHLTRRMNLFVGALALLVTLALVALLGGATLYLQDAEFIKWKPTVVNWLFAAAFLISQYVGSKPILQ